MPLDIAVVLVGIECSDVPPRKRRVVFTEKRWISNSNSALPAARVIQGKKPADVAVSAWARETGLTPARQWKLIGTHKRAGNKHRRAHEVLLMRAMFPPDKLPPVGEVRYVEDPGKGQVCVFSAVLEVILREGSNLLPWHRHLIEKSIRSL